MNPPVQYRGHLKVITGEGYVDDLEAWLTALADSLDELANRYPGYATYLASKRVSEAAGAVAVVGQAASAAAAILHRSVPSGPPLQSNTG